MISKKILVLGLDQAGKTSIVQSLRGISNLPSFCSLSPTRGKNANNFELLNSEYNIWDFGGQEQYREAYSSQLDEFRVGVNKMIFVIDIQDPERYDLAIDYFRTIISWFQDTIDFELSFFLHKYDPDIEVTHPELSDNLVEDLIEKIKKFVPNNVLYSIFKTSIYTIFKKTIVE